MSGIIKTIPVRQKKQLSNNTAYGRGKLAAHSIACPCCSTRNIEFSTSTRLSEVKIGEAKKRDRSRGRARLSCQVCNGKQIIHVSFNGKKDILTDLEKGMSQDRLVMLAMDSVKAFNNAIRSGHA